MLRNGSQEASGLKIKPIEMKCTLISLAKKTENPKIIE